MVNQPAGNGLDRLGLVRIDCPYPVVALGLARVLEEARIRCEHEHPERDKEELPDFVILCIDDVEDLHEGIEHARRPNPVAPVLVFGLQVDLPLAQAALRAGARGFIHVEMQPEQIVRALRVASKGEVVAPRGLLEFLITGGDLMELDMLTARQREILEFVGDGLTNAQIARRLFLTESTVKQHLRAAYKLLGVKNRTEAAKLIRNDR